MTTGPIGVFDSGYGGLTVLSELRRVLPEADFIYLGDNARAPYGVRSFELVYKFTLEAVRYLFGLSCPLVILACNTASAKALRTIQQRDLPNIDVDRRVLGVIRPTVEVLSQVTHTGSVGLLGTPGTVASRSYDMEIAKLAPDIKFHSLAAPMWVSLVENLEADSEGADFFIKRDIERLLAADERIDTIILGCTHYPVLLPKIRKYVPSGVTILSQGSIVAASLKDYLIRHKDMNAAVTRGASTTYLTTECAEKFASMASVFMQETVQPQSVVIE